MYQWALHSLVSFYAVNTILYFVAGAYDIFASGAMVSIYGYHNSIIPQAIFQSAKPIGALFAYFLDGFL